MNKKVGICIIIALLVVAIAVCTAFLVKDDDTYKEFDGNEQYQLEESGAKEYSSPVLVVYGEDETLVGVTQLGNKVQLDNPDNIIIEQGSVISEVQIKVGDDGIRRGSVCYPYTVTITPPVYCTEEMAPQALAEQCLNAQLGGAGLASVYDYKINRIDLIHRKGEEGTAVMRFKVSCDVIPSAVSMAYGPADDDGWVKDVVLDYSVWGTNGVWYMSGDDPIYDMAADYMSAKEREYEETVFFENDEGVSLRSAGFYTMDETILKDEPIGKEEMKAGIDLDEEDDEVTSYYTELFCVDAKTGRKTVLEHGKHNFQYTYLHAKENSVYLTGNTWETESEIFGNHLICVDLSDFSVNYIADFCTVLGITEDAIYAVGVDLSETERKQRLYATDLESGELKWVSDLPYEPTEDNFIVANGVYDGYVHVMYSNDKITFKADEMTGIWEID